MAKPRADNIYIGSLKKIMKNPETEPRVRLEATKLYAEYKGLIRNGKPAKTLAVQDEITPISDNLRSLLQMAGETKQ